MKGKNMNRFQNIAMLTLSLGVFAGCGGNKGEVAEYVEPLTNVEYFTVTPAQFVQNITLPVVVMPSQEVALGLVNGGRVTKINVDKGSRVKAGQVLLETDDVMIRAQVDIAKANCDYQENEFARNEKLARDGAVTQAQYDAAKLALAQAKNSLTIAQKTLDDATLKASFGGIVTMRNVEIGDMLSPGAPAFRIINMNRIKVQAGIPEKYINDFEVGSRVVILMDAIPGREFEARLNYLSPEATSDVRTFLAEMDIANPDGVLRAGIMGNAHILRKTVDDALLIPLNALVTTQEGPVVYILKENNTVVLRKVTSLGSNDRMVRISGVEPGERIIARGQQDLSDGEQVKVTGEYSPIIAEETQE
jgi:membrane fusion protein, multidrug efflux system